MKSCLPSFLLYKLIAYFDDVLVLTCKWHFIQARVRTVTRGRAITRGEHSNNMNFRYDWLAGGRTKEFDQTHWNSVGGCHRENLRGHIIYESRRTTMTAEKTSAISSSFSSALYRTTTQTSIVKTFFSLFAAAEAHAAARLISRKNVREHGELRASFSQEVPRFFRRHELSFA